MTFKMGNTKHQQKLKCTEIFTGRAGTGIIVSQILVHDISSLLHEMNGEVFLLNHFMCVFKNMAVPQTSRLDVVCWNLCPSFWRPPLPALFVVFKGSFSIMQCRVPGVCQQTERKDKGHTFPTILNGPSKMQNTIVLSAFLQRDGKYLPWIKAC